MYKRTTENNNNEQQAAAPYVAPQVRMVEVRIEKGFAQSVYGEGDDISINR
ncbi:MAG: hypothetical protein IJ013_04280 [Bacteroidaceae bacterium]|nr:hypothetical protein [Bacteroidaceae bacterium]